MTLDAWPFLPMRNALPAPYSEIGLVKFLSHYIVSKKSERTSSLLAIDRDTPAKQLSYHSRQAKRSTLLNWPVSMRAPPPEFIIASNAYLNGVASLQAF